MAQCLRCDRKATKGLLCGRCDADEAVIALIVVVVVVASIAVWVLS